jgi:hypothetical protein
MSKEATKMYSTWFSTSPRGYCDRNFLLGCASGLYFRGAKSEECSEETPLDGVLELELGSDVRFVSIIGGLGLLEGLECLDISEADLDEGKEDRDVLVFAPPLPLEMDDVAGVISVVPLVPLVVGRRGILAMLL